jgi:hypothetical protein
LSTITSILQKPDKSLITPHIDFWVIGGASLLFWIVSQSFSYFSGLSPRTGYYLNNLPLFFTTLSLIVNYPHFMVSYQLAYGRGQKFIFKNWFQLILIPFILVSMGLVAWFFFNSSHNSIVVLFSQLNHSLTPLGLKIPIGLFPRVGLDITGLLVNFMFFTVGWHYTKQAFGCTMVYSSLQKYRYSNWQRILLRYSLLSIWLLNFSSYAIGSTSKLDSFTFFTAKIPHFFYQVSPYLCITLFLATLYFIFYKNYKDNNQLPTIYMLAPFLAIYAWWMPLGRTNLFYIYAVPFFHSLQYFPFTYKLLKGRENKKVLAQKSSLGLGWNFVLLCFAGLLIFEFIPDVLDGSLQSKGKTSFSFWYVYAMLIINIHHYFIDNIIWRFDNEEVKENLLS